MSVPVYGRICTSEASTALAVPLVERNSYYAMVLVYKYDGENRQEALTITKQ